MGGKKKKAGVADRVPPPTATSESSPILDELYEEIQRQREVINLLTTRLNFVLTMFGIDEVTTGPPVSDIPDSEVSQPVTSFSSAVKTTSTAKASFQTAVLSTINKEHKEQAIRSKNFLVYGLPATENCTDEQTVEQLLQTELDLQPEIKLCKRVGKKVPGKVQPLKVTVASQEQVSAIVSNARNLRHSKDDYIKESVYINRDLTKAQADAAYLARCQRRQARATRVGQQNDGHSSQHRNSASSVDRCPDGT